MKRLTRKTWLPGTARSSELLHISRSILVGNHCGIDHWSRQCVKQVTRLSAYQLDRRSAKAAWHNPEPIMRFACILIALATLSGGAILPHSQANAETWTPLFNGKNLDGWTVAYANTAVDSRPASALFEVADGAIHAYSKDAAGSAQSQAYIQTVSDYSDYHLRLEYRWGEKKFLPRLDLVRDAGLLYHVYGAAPEAWPRSAEFQIQEGDTGDLWAISTRVTSTADPKTGLYAAPEEGGTTLTVGAYDDFERVPHANLNLEKPGWNTIDLIVRGDSAVYMVNGVVNMKVTDIKSFDTASQSWVRLDHGKIALQAEYAEVYYRNIQIKKLAPSAP
jgi:hypothetical protein